MSELGILKAACALVRAGGGQGTGYLVSPTQLATCEHVVESAGEGALVDVVFGARTLKAKVTRMDRATDCALLELPEPMPDVQPLVLAARCEAGALWDGYGFPGLAADSGVPFFGKILDPEAIDDLKRPVAMLYSDQLGAGLAAKVNGLSGGPVVVGGAVIGHFSRVLGTPGAPGQPALAVVYAARASNLLALMGKTPALAVAKGPSTAGLASQIPPVGPGEYHIFISYRSSDRPFAKKLYERLDAVGFRVFMDQRELVVGDQLAGRLHEAMARSRCGIVLVSKAWGESPWCVAEGNVMMARAIERPAEFRVIPLHLDASPMHSLFASLLRVEFAGEAVPTGRKLEQVIYAAIGQPPPPEDSAERKVHITETDATDEALEALEKMSRDATKFRPLVDFLRNSGLPVVAATNGAAERLLGAGRAEEALAILPSSRSLRVAQLRALALSRLGRHDEARDILEPLFEKGQTDAETGGILGGIYKRLWQNTSSRKFLIKSHQTYTVSHAASADSYVGINVATMALLLGRKDEADKVAAAVVDDLGSRDLRDLDHWNLATIGEAYLIQGKLSDAAQFYEKAVAKADTRPQDVAVMRRQARLLLQHQKLERGALDLSLPVPEVVAFSGHLTDDPKRAIPRFPESKVEVVRRRIRDWLKGHGGCVHAVCSAARGGDLIFLDEVLRLGGSATVFLPFPGPDFRKASVGQGWDPHFDRILSDPRVAVRDPLLKVAPPEVQQPQAFARCNTAILDEAERMAILFDDPDPLLLTVWNGAGAGGAGGTAEVVTGWKERGHEAENIDPAKL